METVKKEKNQYCCAPFDKKLGCCKVESIVSIDDRGQMVLPKEIREKANIRTGDKLAVVAWENEGKICCISLIRAEDFAEMVEGLLGPMMEEVLKKKRI